MRHEYQRVPVTALAFLSDHHLLAGEGFRLRLYDLRSGCVLNDVSVFERQAIHGIIVHDDFRTVSVCGGSSFRFLNVTLADDERPELLLQPIRTAHDWILDAAFAPGVAYESPTVATISAHNALSLITAGSSASRSLNTAETHEVVAGSNCILYSAHVKWLSSSQCLVASGTAFGDIILWSAFFPQKEEKVPVVAKTHYTFSAHEGSVFGVQLSSMLKPPGPHYSNDGTDSSNEIRVLASCSDDRTIQLWDVSDLSVESPTLTQVQRDTGFGSRPNQAPGAPPLLAKVMGHVSRIWAVRFLSPPAVSVQNDLRIMSFGEDASCIEWDVQPGVENSTTSLPFCLRQVRAETAHTGKNIWSMAINPSVGCIATGGADGAIALHSENVSSSEECSEISSSLLDGGDNFKSYCFVDNHRLFATTISGAVVEVDLQAGDSRGLRTISAPLADLRGYSVVTGVRGNGFVGGATGTVYAYLAQDGLREIAQVDRKIANLFAHAQHEDDVVDLLVTCVGGTTAQLVRLSHESNTAVEKEDQAKWTIALPEGFAVTSFVSRKSGDVTYAILGSRNGSIAIYSLPTLATSTPIEATISFTEAHGKETVTSLHFINHNEDTSTEDLHLSSTGRDGTFAIHRLQNSPSGLSLQTIHQLSLPFGPSIEGLNTSSPNQLLVWGFRNKHFIVHDLLPQREILSVECGGAHRNWAYSPGAEGGTFVWTKASRLFCKTQRRLAYRLLKRSSGHGREIKAVAVSPAKSSTRAGGEESTRSRRQQRRVIVATGAEDTDIRLWTLDPDRQESGGPGDIESSSSSAASLQCLHTLRKHNTGIQHLCWSADGRYLFSSGGFEEFFVWRIVPETPLVGIGVMCASAQPRSGTSDLRIMGFDVMEVGDRWQMRSHGLENGDKHDSTGTDIDFKLAGRDTFVISMAYSDSTMKLWQYIDFEQATANSQQPWHLLATGDYLTACLTQARFLSLPRSPPSSSPSGSFLNAAQAKDDRLFLLTASTDGHLVLWPAPTPSTTITATPQSAASSLTWQRRHRVHQSAVLALATWTLPSVGLASLPAAAAEATTAAQGGVASGSRSAPVFNATTAVADTGKTTTTVIVTGGDDGAVGITLLRIRRSTDDTNLDLAVHNADGGEDGQGDGNSRRNEATPSMTAEAMVSSFSSLVIPRAHAAAVTGVAILPLHPDRDHSDDRYGSHGADKDGDALNEDDGRDEDRILSHLHSKNDGNVISLGVVSTGVDQRVKQWKLELDLRKLDQGVEGLQVRKVRSTGTAVADVSGLEVYYDQIDSTDSDNVHSRLVGEEGIQDAKTEKSGVRRQRAREVGGVLVSGVGMEAWKLRW